MCLSCGCGKLHEDHGNPDNIVYEDLERAAKAADDIPIEQVVNNIASGLTQG